MRRHRLYLLAGMVSFALAVAGCATTPGRITADLPGRYIPLTRPIIAVGDTQEHNATGLSAAPGGWRRRQLCRGRPKAAGTAALRAQASGVGHPAASRRAAHPPRRRGRHVLQVGVAADATDLSIRTARRRRYLPGNHDGLLFGIFNHDLLTDYLNGDVLEWQRGCRSVDEDEEVSADADGRGPALNKRMFIQKYIELAGRRPGLPPSGCRRPAG